MRRIGQVLVISSIMLVVGLAGYCHFGTSYRSRSVHRQIIELVNFSSIQGFNAGYLEGDVSQAKRVIRRNGWGT